MSSTHVALIRGINVGRAKRVAMVDLRKLMEGLGYSAVRTLLNSGNIVFRADSSEGNATCIEAAMTEQLGVSAHVTVLTAAEIATLVAENPLGEVADDPSRLLVAVLKEPAHRVQLEPLTQQDWVPDVLGIGSRAAYIWCSEGVLASKLPKAVGRALGDGVTTRNWSTITKLHTLVADANSSD